MNRFIMADGQQCIGCRACEVACVMAHNGEQHVLSERHFHPRITVLRAGEKRSPVTCHHCENAPCAQSCPNGAISKCDDSVQVNQQKCIGCKACAVACPFGTMEIIVTPLGSGGVKASANKCDLCQARTNGPACIENCPADVLSLATPALLDNLAKSRRQRAASLEARPWHAEAVREDVPRTKLQQMQTTPPRGEPDKLAGAERVGHFNEIYLPFRAEQAAREALAAVGLSDFEDVPAGQLSQGQRRRVALARLWVSESVPLWVLDEPFTALDVKAVERLSDLISRHVREGGVVMLVTHQEVPVDRSQLHVVEPESWAPRRMSRVEREMADAAAREEENAAR